MQGLHAIARPLLLLVLFAAGQTAPAAQSPRVVSLDGTWQLAVDPGNAGTGEKWFAAPKDGAKTSRVPWIIQDAFPGYHGVAWYWRAFDPPQLEPNQRCLLRFWAVDYKAEVWLNGVLLGGHEGGETPFTLDATDALRRDQQNLVAVRVLNPSHQRIDGMVLNETPHQARVIPYSAGAAYNHGGITGSVELLVVPAVRVEDLYVHADPRTGILHVQAALHNAGKPTSAEMEFSVAPAAGGATLQSVRMTRPLAAGDNLVAAEIKLAQPHLWDLNDPYLYRVTARATGESVDEASVRCGFRDFRFENGAFRLNGRRLYLRSTHTCNHFPIGLKLPPDPDMARRDLLDLKAMGFNMIRFIWGGAERYQLDLCDEIGLMVYEESFASSAMDDSPQLAARWNAAVSDLVRRDRNHPAVVIWGLLNEIRQGKQFALAAACLPMLRQLDDSRMVFLNSGRWDLSSDSGVFSHLDIWHSAADREPWVTKNPAAAPVETPFGFVWPAGQLAIHPGQNGESGAVRFTAPAAGRCRIETVFRGLNRATVDVHVLHNGKGLFEDRLNLAGRPNEARHAGELTVALGDTLDFVVGYGNESYGSDSTAFSAAVELQGKKFDAAAEFSGRDNPAGPWAYGLFPPKRLDRASFVPFTQNRTSIGPRLGSLANPDSAVWEDVLADRHEYPRVPHTAGTIQSLRTLSGGSTPMFLSEYGIGSAVDLWRVTRHYERLGKSDVEDARFYRDKLDRFLADWKQWKLDEAFARPEDFFAASLAKMAGERTRGLNAIRANPNVVGHSLTGMNDHVSCGEGLTTTFRELKPGTVDALFEGLAPLRLCLFAEPACAYRGGRFRIEAVLANEDALPPGRYPVRLVIAGPENRRVFEKTVAVTVAKDSPMAISFFAEDVTLDVPAGRYRLLGSLERGGAATGGLAEFHIADRAALPKVTTSIALAGDDPAMVRWLGEQGVQTTAFDPAKPAKAILVPSAVPEATLARVVEHVRGGATAVFLSPAAFRRGDDSTALLPLTKRGAVTSIYGWLYLKDEWAKPHPIFDGLPTGLMDYTYYRELISDLVLVGQDPPAEAVAGAIKASQDYGSGLMLAVYPLDRGRIVLNTLLIRENLGTHPAADRLLLNLLRFAAGGNN